MKRSAVWLSLGLLACTTQVWAQTPASVRTAAAIASSAGSIERGDRAENRFDRRGDRVDQPPGPCIESRGKARP